MILLNHGVVHEGVGSGNHRGIYGNTGALSFSLRDSCGILGETWKPREHRFELVSRPVDCPVEDMALPVDLVRSERGSVRRFDVLPQPSNDVLNRRGFRSDAVCDLAIDLLKSLLEPGTFDLLGVPVQQ